MKNKLFGAILTFLIVFCSYNQLNAEVIYEQSNNPANYVKLEKNREVKSANHPYSFDKDVMADLLRSVRYSRKALFSDDIKTNFVFEEESVQKYSPYLVEAFQKASPEQAVFLSLAQSRPYAIIRNDRLTQVRLWVEADGLHMKFIKTEAKLHGDYKSKTTGKKLIYNAKSLRVALEAQEGQQFALDSTEEIVFNLNTDWQGVVTRLDDEESAREAAKDTRKNRRQKSNTSNTIDESAPAPKASPEQQQNAESRLTELKRLKEKGLISDEDYESKKSEILKDL